MYCPECNRPLVGAPEVCPGCGHQFKSDGAATSGEYMDQKASSKSSVSSSPQQVGQGQPGPEPKLEKKTLFSAIILAIPIISFFLYILVFQVSGSTPSMGLRIVTGLLALISFFLIPLSLILGIFGMRTIKNSAEALAGKSLAFLTISISSLLILGGVITTVIAMMNLDMDNLIETLSGSNPERVIILIERGIENKEAQNRNDGLQNSFGSFFPNVLDPAEPLSNSGPDNPFFTSVIQITNGWNFPGWKKGSEINTYILLSDSSQYSYDPMDGTFQKK